MESLQPQLFDPSETTVDIKTVLLYALGEFQSRGHELADRELALDRLHGAFLRAFEEFGVPAVSDEVIAQGLRNLGANVVELPIFVAKRPFRVTVSKEIGDKALEWFRDR